MSQLIGFQCDYLDRMTWGSFYLEPLAVIFSLTYALLMWSCVVVPLVPQFPDSDMTNLYRVCAFFVALLLFSFRNATTHIRASLGAASGFVTVLIIWCIINFWDSESSDSERDGLIDILPEDEPHTTWRAGLSLRFWREGIAAIR